MSQTPNLPAAQQRKQQALTTLNDLLNRMKPQLKMALPRHLTPERLIRVAITAWHRTPALQECSPMSILGAVVQAAQLGLEPDSVLGHAYLVPFRNRKTGQKECQLIAGYKGLIELARRSAQIEAIDSRAVYQKDHFDYRLGLHPKLEHVPAAEEDRGELIHVWAVAHFKGGGHQVEVMSRPEIEKVRKSSKAADDGPWVTHYEEMARKTVLRRLCKFLPLSPEIQRHVNAEEMADAGIIEGAIIEGIEVPQIEREEPEPPKQSNSDQLADKLGATIKPPPEKPVEAPPAREPGDEPPANTGLVDDLTQRLAEASTVTDFDRALNDWTKAKDQLSEEQNAVVEAAYDEHKGKWRGRRSAAKQQGGLLPEAAGRQG